MILGLRDKGNTVLIVEHNRDVIVLADWVIDVGPLAGKEGGEIVYQGDVKGLLQSKTITGIALQQKTSIESEPKTTNRFFGDSKYSNTQFEKYYCSYSFRGFGVYYWGLQGLGKAPY